MQTKEKKRQRRHARVRAKIQGTKEVPRLAVFKSNRHFMAQLIDDTQGKTLVASSDMSIKGTDTKKKKEVAMLVGEDIAKKAQAKKIKKVVFDRGGFAYTGNIKDLAESARKGGLEF